MSHLVPTLTTQLAAADALHATGRWPQARRAYEDLVERAQEKADRATESTARAMLAWCLLRLRDREGARDQLGWAGRIADPNHLEAYGRYRMVLVRLAIDDGPQDVARAEIHHYLRWAEDLRRGAAILDACLLMARAHEPADRVEWLERGIEQAVALETTAEIGVAYSELAGALDQLGQCERALEAYQRALHWYREQGRRRDEIAAGWAVGALACRLEDWPLGRTILEEAIGTAERAGGCEDLLALALADLATVYEAAGDVIEARRILLRALALGRDQDLVAIWPERWAAVLGHAQRLEVLR